MEDIREKSRQLEITTGELASARVTLEGVKAALQDPAQVHAMMLRKEIAWEPAKIRHLLGGDDLKDMLIRCEGWFSTLTEGRRMQLECQRVIALHNTAKSPTHQTKQTKPTP
jgi:hypothetical protein